MDPTRNPRTDPGVKSSTPAGSRRTDASNELSGSKPGTRSRERTKPGQDVDKISGYRPPEHTEEGSPRGAAEEGTMTTGTSTGQTTRGSYSTDPATGGGRYGDHSSGQFTVDPLGQPGSEEPIDPKI
jgi:hypothetical protein